MSNDIPKKHQTSLRQLRKRFEEIGHTHGRGRGATIPKRKLQACRANLVKRKKFKEVAVTHPAFAAAISQSKKLGVSWVNNVFLTPNFTGAIFMGMKESRYHVYYLPQHAIEPVRQRRKHKARRRVTKPEQYKLF